MRSLFIYEIAISNVKSINICVCSWAQLLGGVDFLPRHDVSTDDEAVVCQVDKGIELYRREQRVPQFLQRIRQHSLDLTDFK